MIFLKGNRRNWFIITTIRFLIPKTMNAKDCVISATVEVVPFLAFGSRMFLEFEDKLNRFGFRKIRYDFSLLIKQNAD